MAYALYSQTYGLSKASCPVVITRSDTGQPATIMSSSTGGVLNDRGQAILDSSGNLNVYIDTAFTWTVAINDIHPSKRTTLQLLTEDNAQPQILDGAGNTVSPFNVAIYNGPFAGRPAASSVPLNSTAIFTDIGITQTTWRAGATVWLPDGGEIVLAQSGLPGATVTGTTSAVTQLLCTIPGGLLGPNGALEVSGTFTMPNNSNTKTVQILLGAAASPNGQVSIYSAGLTTSTQASFNATFWNRGVQNSNQTHFNLSSGLGANSSSSNVVSVDTTIDQALNAVITLAVGTDSVKIERWTVKARPF